MPFDESDKVLMEIIVRNRVPGLMLKLCALIRHYWGGSAATHDLDGTRTRKSVDALAPVQRWKVLLSRRNLKESFMKLSSWLGLYRKFSLLLETETRH